MVPVDPPRPLITIRTLARSQRRGGSPIGGAFVPPGGHQARTDARTLTNNTASLDAGGRTARWELMTDAGASVPRAYSAWLYVFLPVDDLGFEPSDRATIERTGWKIASGQSS